VDPEIINLFKRIPTKREVLRVIMPTFDPHGLVSPVIVNAKVLLQDIWRQGFGWDQPLSQHLFDKWEDCLKEMKMVV
jgi:hypothetical protein